MRLLETFSVTTAESERGLSEMNSVLTKDRKRLGSARLSSLMTVSMETAHPSRFNAGRFLKVFDEKFGPVLKSDFQRKTHMRISESDRFSI